MCGQRPSVAPRTQHACPLGRPTSHSSAPLVLSRQQQAPSARAHTHSRGGGAPAPAAQSRRCRSSPGGRCSAPWSGSREGGRRRVRQRVRRRIVVLTSRLSSRAGRLRGMCARHTGWAPHVYTAPPSAGTAGAARREQAHLQHADLLLVLGQQVQGVKAQEAGVVLVLQAVELQGGGGRAGGER